MSDQSVSTPAPPSAVLERAARRLEAELYDLAALEREASMMAPGRDRVWVAEERR